MAFRNKIEVNNSFFSHFMHTFERIVLFLHPVSIKKGNGRFDRTAGGSRPHN